MADQPGAGELITPPSTLPSREQEYTDKFVLELHRITDDYEKSVVHPLPPIQYEDAKKIGLDYQASYMPTLEETEGNPEAARIINQAGAGYNAWFEKDFLSFQQSYLAKNPNGNVDRVEELKADLRHDFGSDFLNGFSGSLTDDEYMREAVPYFANDFTIRWPSHVMRRIAKQIEGKADMKPINVDESSAYMLGIFKTLTAEAANNFELDFGTDQPSGLQIQGDIDYLLGVLFNPPNNSRFIGIERSVRPIKIKLQVTEDPLNSNNVLFAIHDNVGGFPPEFLQTEEGETVQNAFKRGKSKRKGGTGAGLAIVQEVVKDHFHGTVLADNEKYPGTEEMGAVVKISIPKYTG